MNASEIRQKHDKETTYKNEKDKTGSPSPNIAFCCSRCLTVDSATASIYWGTRTAHVYAGSYQPQSQVLFVTYAAEPKSASPWRGFRRRNF
jgi:hypothetical protein